MQQFDLSGTQTGRLSSARPNNPVQPRDKTLFDVSYWRPKGTPIRSALNGDSLLSSSIQNILNLDYKKLEQRVWGSYYSPPYKYDFWNIINKSYGPKAAGPLLSYPLLSYVHDEVIIKNIYVTGRPVDITANETFRVEIAFPPSWCDGKIVASKQCQCEMRTLMREGCQCGGV